MRVFERRESGTEREPEGELEGAVGAARAAVEAIKAVTKVSDSCILLE